MSRLWHTIVDLNPALKVQEIVFNNWWNRMHSSYSKSCALTYVSYFAQTFPFFPLFWFCFLSSSKSKLGGWGGDLKPYVKTNNAKITTPSTGKATFADTTSDNSMLLLEETHFVCRVRQQNMDYTTSWGELLRPLIFEDFVLTSLAVHVIKYCVL